MRCPRRYSTSWKRAVMAVRINQTVRITRAPAVIIPAPPAEYIPVIGERGPEGRAGSAGVNGRDGKDGVDGKDGKPGKNGVTQVIHAGGGGSSATTTAVGTPTVVHADTTFRVPFETQMLAFIPIVVDGTLIVDGILVNL